MRVLGRMDVRLFSVVLRSEVLTLRVKQPHFMVLAIHTPFSSFS